MEGQAEEGNQLDSTSRQIGIDAGGTLIKIVCRQADDSMTFLSYATSELERAARWIAERMEKDHARVCVTGGKAALLQSLLPKEAAQLLEFEATVTGVQWLLKQQGIPLTQFLLTNVGTGTSIHYVGEDKHYRVGGTGVGGGTLIGLSAMATGITAFEEIVSLASAGIRDEIDLKVSHIYEGSVPPIPGELTASNFGRWQQTGGSTRKEDLLASVVGLVGETVATISVHAAGQCGASSVIYIGSSFVHNELLRKVVADYTELRGSKALMLRNGEYSGAIGALQTLNHTSL